METERAARAWIDAWTRGWLAHDPDVIAARYAEGCDFRSHPFREPLRGPQGARAYAERAFAEERSARPSFDEPIVGSAGRAAVEYRAEVVNADGTEARLAGVTVLRFDEDGLVLEHRDYWVLR